MGLVRSLQPPGTELALFTEAAGTLSVGGGCRTLPPGWRCRAPSRLGLRSTGKKVNSESPCAPRSHSWKKNREREKERKGKKEWHGETKLQWARLITLFSKELLYLYLYIEGNERCKVIQSQHKHYICFVFIKTRIFSAYLSHKQCCVHYLLALEACGHFMTLFW